jgi:mono/diheme cytochrome c family protein
MPLRRGAIFWLALALGGPAAGADLRFVRDGAAVGRIDVDALRRDCGARTVAVHDPYYDGATKRYVACPLADVLRRGFGALPAPGDDVIFRATDGYAKPATGARVATDGGWVAFADADRPSGFAPIGRQQADPGPLYVVWSGPGQDDPHVWPWPWALAEIEITDVTKRWPYIVPRGVAEDGPAWHGFAIFRTECIACHSINAQGGKVGPDLNVPRSVIEYRDVAFLRAYIRDPQAFRYGSMPAHPHLSDADLDALLAYFRTMRDQKHDPGHRE